MAEPLKNSFGPDVPRWIADRVEAAFPGLERETFLQVALDGYDELELTPRARHISNALARVLPKDREHAIRIVIDAVGRETGSARGESVGGFAPGRGPDAFRDNSGRLIPKGSSLLLQMHYTATGKETVDETEVGIYVYDEPPQYVMAGGVAGQRRFFVPAYEKEYKLEGEQLVERDAYLYSMTPHMHFRGKYMSYTAVYPDGREEFWTSVANINPEELSATHTVEFVKDGVVISTTASLVDVLSDDRTIWVTTPLPEGWHGLSTVDTALSGSHVVITK